MADITLHTDSAVHRTVVPNSFIDAYMIHANGEYVKVYLYLLRCMNDPNMNFSVSDAADKFEHTETDILRALKYWEKVHLLRLEFDAAGELSGICFLDIASTEPTPVATLLPAERKPAAEPPAHENYSAEQLKALGGEADVREILFVAEHYLGHTLNATEMNAILYWKDSLHFSSDLIDYLIESCVAKNHKSIYYMEKIALAWAEAGITTVSAAKEESTRYNDLYTTVRKAFGIQNRDFFPHEREYLTRWQDAYSFDAAIIGEACARTVRTIHQPSFAYAEKILDRWKTHQVRTIQDVHALDAAHQEKAVTAAEKRAEAAAKKNQFSNFPQRSYNTSELERELLNYGAH